MKVFVDTSALLAVLDADDRRHAEAKAVFTWLAANAELVTHNYVEVEALAVARRRLGPAAVDALVAILALVRTEWVDEDLHRDALTGHRAAGGSASLVDHVSFALLRRLGITDAFAFDADFEAQGFRRPTVPSGVPPSRRVQEAAATYGSDLGPTDLVSIAEIALRSGRPVNTIQSWRRRHGDFPAPMAQLAAGPVWTWDAVEPWIAQRRRARATTLPTDALPKR